MSEMLQMVEETMALIDELKANYTIQPSKNDDLLLYTGVAERNVVEQISPVVEKYFGKPYKKAGKSVFLKNMTDGFAKAVGGMRKEQTFFKKDISASLQLYCAFWPWGTNPEKTTVRIGVLTDGSGEDEAGAIEIMKKYR